MLPAQQGYDRAITVFSPDGRLYQVEYAIETVNRGTVAVGIKSSDGVVFAAEERSKKLQIDAHAQKIFQIADHIGVAAAGYIPDARSMVDNARFFAQSNQLVHDEPVGPETLTKHLADMCQNYTQFAGVRPMGVSLIIGGVDASGRNGLFLTDPSGTYIQYDAVAIGSNATKVTDFLEKSLKPDIGMDDAATLAAAAVNMSGGAMSDSAHIRMACIRKESKTFETISEDDAAAYAESAASKFPHD